MCMHSLIPFTGFAPLPHVSDMDSPYVDIYPFAPVANLDFLIT